MTIIRHLALIDGFLVVITSVNHRHQFEARVQRYKTYGNGSTTLESSGLYDDEQGAIRRFNALADVLVGGAS